MRKPTVEVPFYSSEKIYLAHEIGYWCGKLDHHMNSEEWERTAALKFAAQCAFHYAGLWLNLVEKEV